MTDLFKVGALALVLAMGVPQAAAYDLAKPEDLVEAYVKTVGDISGKESFTYAHAVVMSFVPGERGRKLFGLDVVGASRFLPIEGGFQRLHREVGLYTDLETGEVLATWSNPWLERDVEVIHIQNDPVNFPFTVARQEGPRKIVYEDFGDYIAFHREVLLRYPSVMPRADYPLHSKGDMYEAAELFNSFARKADLENPDVTSIDEVGSWSRIGPWLPWMEMGNREGWLLYHGRSHKLMNGIDGIPAPVRAYMEKHLPKYLSAPTQFEEPNETSWTYFKKVLDAQ